MSITPSQRTATTKAPAYEMARSAWMWAYRVPWLPDIGSDTARIESTSLIFGYHNLAEALAASRTPDTALQLRITAPGSDASGAGTIELLIIGKGRTQDQADRLEGLLLASLPIEIPLHPVEDVTDLRAVLGRINPMDNPHVATAEIRRRIEDADTLPGAALTDTRAVPCVLRWEPDALGLRGFITSLSRATTPTMLIVHLQPASPTMAALDHIDSLIREIAADQDPAGNPIRRQVAGDYLRYMRDLPRAGLSIRVQLHAQQRLLPGLAESVGMGLTSDESFTVISPRTDRELALASELAETATSRWWASTGDPVIDEVLQLCDPDEAGRVFRFPVPAYGGTIGLPSAPLNTLPRGAHIDSQDRNGVTLGAATGGGQVKLSLRELNQHLLVAGLPGFGKSTSVQSVLYQLWTDHKTPFLVLDPAKSDYIALADSLSSSGANHISLTPTRPAFNPLAVPEGCTPQTHAGRILAAFDAALGLSSHWPIGYITLGRALFAAYEDTEPGTSPTLRSLYASLGDTIRRARLSGPEASNVKASLLGRIEFLVRGPLGAALTSDHNSGINWPELLARPTIIEMKEFGGPVERSLVFALILASLISYREANPTRGTLGHVTVLEEAHRVLSGTGVAAESEGVRLLVEAIAELRGSGQGFIVVDQAPTLLHPGVTKLTGSLLTHRLVEPNERLLIGAALLLDERQQTDLARLAMGQAVLYSSDRTSPVVVNITPKAELASLNNQPARTTSTLGKQDGADPPWCFGCRDMCRHARRGQQIKTTLPPSSDPRQLLEAALNTATNGGKTTNTAIHAARCGAGAQLAAQHHDPRTFLRALRDLDDETERLVVANRPEPN